MAFAKPEKTGIVDFISSMDDAIDTSIDAETGEPRSNLEKYREDWDFAKHCRLVQGGEPTKFKLNLNVPYKRQVLIENSSVKANASSKSVDFQFGSHKYTVARCVLVGIENPPSLPEEKRLLFKADNEGLAADELLSMLGQCGIVDEIYMYYTMYGVKVDRVKKK